MGERRKQEIEEKKARLAELRRARAERQKLLAQAEAGSPDVSVVVGHQADPAAFPNTPGHMLTDHSHQRLGWETAKRKSTTSSMLSWRLTDLGRRTPPAADRHAPAYRPSSLMRARRLRLCPAHRHEAARALRKVDLGHGPSP